LPPGEGDPGMSPVKTSTYVPEFQTTTSRVNSSGEPSQVATMSSPGADLPERKPGLFDLFKSKKSEPVNVDPGANPYTADALAPPAASYEQPGAVATAPAGAAPMVDPSEAIAAATVAPAPSEKPDFFSRLFGKGKKTSPAEAVVSVPDYVGTAPAAPAEPSATVAPAAEAAGIPTPPAYTEGAPTPPAADSGSGD